VTFDDVAANLGGVAYGKLAADANLRLEAFERPRLGRIHLHRKAIGLEMLHPVAAAFAGRRLPNLDAWVIGGGMER
jgi:hypothetical protein